MLALYEMPLAKRHDTQSVRALPKASVGHMSITDDYYKMFGVRLPDRWAFSAGVDQYGFAFAEGRRISWLLDTEGDLYRYVRPEDDAS